MSTRTACAEQKRFVHSLVELPERKLYAALFWSAGDKRLYFALFWRARVYTSTTFILKEFSPVNLAPLLVQNTGNRETPESDIKAASPALVPDTQCVSQPVVCILAAHIQHCQQDVTMLFKGHSFVKY
jgi:hypothetical protein